MAAIPFVVWLLATANGGAVDARHAWALGLFIGAALTDFLDGQIARRTNTITEFGKIVDPLADRLLVISALVVLMARQFMPLWMGILIVSRDVIMLAGAPIVGIKEPDKIAVHWTGKVATALLFLSLCFFILWGRKGYLQPVGFWLFLPGILFSYISGLIYLYRGIMTVKHRDRAEPGSSEVAT
jgi:CDP-diacylglycerol--glycerol-3-phosphate 3-phosphatidyltransferase